MEVGKLCGGSFNATAGLVCFFVVRSQIYECVKILVAEV